MTDAFPHDVDPEIWIRDGANRFVRADRAAIYGIGRGQWEATLDDHGVSRQILTLRRKVRNFPSAGAAARFLAHHHPQKGNHP